MTVYTGNIKLQRSSDHGSDYETVVDLEAYGDTKFDVLRKLFLNSYLVADIYKKQDQKDGTYYYVSMEYPSIARDNGENIGSGGAVSSAETIIRHSAQNVYFLINDARREVLLEKDVSYFKNNEHKKTVEELKTAVVDDLRYFEEDFGFAVADGRWKKYQVKNKYEYAAQEALRKHRVEQMRRKQIDDTLEAVNINKASLRKEILDDQDTSVWFKVKNWLKTL